MTGEEMEPDVDPPMLPLQGIRLRNTSANDSNTLPIQSHSSIDTRRPGSARPVPRRTVQPSKKGDVSRLPAAARAATRVASQVRRPQTATRPIDRSTTAPSVPTKPRSIYRRPSNPPPTRSSRTAPLLPLSERRQGQNSQLSRPRTNSETERWDITPDGGSGGREGRRFAVSNVGNNGRIYLRYVFLGKWTRDPVVPCVEVLGGYDINRALVTVDPQCALRRKDILNPILSSQSRPLKPPAWAPRQLRPGQTFSISAFCATPNSGRAECPRLQRTNPCYPASSTSATADQGSEEPCLIPRSMNLAWHENQPVVSRSSSRDQETTAVLRQ